EQGEDLLLARIELRLVGLEVGQHVVAVGVHAAMVGGDPDPRRNGGQPLDRAAESPQVGGGIAVVGPEAGEVDVSDEGNAAGLHEQYAMTARMARHVERLDRHAAPEVPALAVRI